MLFQAKKFIKENRLDFSLSLAVRSDFFELKPLCFKTVICVVLVCRFFLFSFVDESVDHGNRQRNGGCDQKNGNNDFCHKTYLLISCFALTINAFFA